MHPPPRPSSCVQVPAASLPPKDRCPENQSLTGAAVGRSRRSGREQDEFMRGFRYLLVVVPIAALVAAAPNLAAQRYTVRWGDTLTGIASAHGVSLHHLARANHMRPRSLRLVGHPVARTPDGNVRIGVAYLHHLLNVFGGDQRLALAAYYQGPAGVRRFGMLRVTKRS